jgi:hypothetical protein
MAQKQLNAEAQGTQSFAETAARILDCGGKAQRRHRFSTADRASKAAWRFASRRNPKRFGCGFAALRRCVVSLSSRLDFLVKRVLPVFVAQAAIVGFVNVGQLG